jgi:UDP-N-acetylglucosamine--N-acetylmuramyl-(pentapeptide) pyrophosphoryl-undecaprenol N-acetylglucosamine transferase
MNNDKNIRVIVAGGGTGGHIFPGLAIAGSLKRLAPSVEILFVGAKGKMEMQKVPEAGFEIKGIDIAGYNRSSLFRNLSLPVKLVKSYFQVKKILKNFKPDAVVGVGGYSSFPVLRLAQAAHIPTFIHESNSLPGKSNLILGKRATKIFVATDGMEKYFHEKNLIVSGNPVRALLQKRAEKNESLLCFGLKPDQKTVLVIGGSLGAKSINEAVAGHISYWKENRLQLIWQTGKNYSPDVANSTSRYENIWANEFINRMDFAYGAADVVVARAGAMTISELEAQGKASILVPYPFAAEDHQTVNARKLADKGAALMIKDSEIGEKLIPVLDDLLGDESRLKSIEENISALAKPDADKLIAEEILKSIKG